MSFALETRAFMEGKLIEEMIYHEEIDWDTVKGVGELVGGLICYGLVVAASNKLMENMSDDHCSAIAGYDDAIGAIMKSGMYSHDKAHAAAALKQNGSSEFYRAIIHIAKDSGMYSHDKVDMIRELSKD